MAMNGATWREDAETKILARVTRDFLLYVVRWIERNFDLV